VAVPATHDDVNDFLQDMRKRGARVVEYTSEPAQTVEQSRDPTIIYGASSPADAMRRAKARIAATAAAPPAKR
jgi:DNA-binding MurR/RpiR family transcriptional regulator